MLRFRCPNCQSPMEVDESMGGRPARCPTCGNTLKIPKTSQTPPATQQGQAARPGATAVKVHGENVEIQPPTEVMALIAVACFGVGVAVLPLCGLLGAGFFGGREWMVGFVFGTLLSFLGAVFGLSAFHNIRRSRGRKGGKLYAQIGMFGGLAFGVLCGVGTIVCVASLAMRPSCEDNLNKLYGALRTYADKHDGHLPKDLEMLVRETYVDTDGKTKRSYLETNAYFTCPAYPGPSGTQTYQLCPDIPMNDRLFPGDLMIVCDGQPYGTHGDRQVRVLTKDGKINLVPADQFRGYLNDQKLKWEAALKAKKKAAGGAEAPAPAEKPAEESAEPAPPEPAPAKEKPAAGPAKTQEKTQ